MIDKTELLKEVAYYEAEEKKARKKKEKWCKEIGVLILQEVDSGQYDILDAFNYWVRNVSKYGEVVSRGPSSLEDFGAPSEYDTRGVYTWDADMFDELFSIYEIKTGRTPRPSRKPSAQEKQNALDSYVLNYVQESEGEFFAALRSLIEKGEKGFDLDW